MVIENLLVGNLIPQNEIYIQIARFFFTLGLGIIITRFALIPLTERATRKRSAGKKVRHQLHNVVLITGLIISLIAALQAGEFGNLVTILGTIAAALTVAIGFGMRDEVANYVVGTIIHLDSPFVRGDYVNIADEEGEVKDITLRSTILNGHSSDRISVPNSKVGTNNIRNHTKGVKTKSSVKMKAEPEKADDMSSLLKQIAQDNDKILDSPSPNILFSDFEDDKLNFSLRYWVKDSSDPRSIKSDVLEDFNKKAVEQGLMEKEEEEAGEEKPEE